MSHPPPDLLARGLLWLPEFLTEGEEHMLLPQLLVPSPAGLRTQPKRNRVQRYGSSVPYSTHMLSATIPDHFAVLGQRLVDRGLLDMLPDSVTINEYLPGDIIPAHIDAPAGGSVITILSLGSSASMCFKRYETSYTVVLPPRSVIQMWGDLRYNWTHEILPVAAKRYSIVFRCSKECNGEIA